MGFRLTVPDVRLVIAQDAVPGGLSAWGEGELEVVIRGDVSLGSFFDLVERFSGLPNEARGLDSSGIARIRSAMRSFGETIIGWNIEGIEPGADGFEALPPQLALAIFTAWQKSAQLDPFSSAVSPNGAVSPVGFAGTAA